MKAWRLVDVAEAGEVRMHWINSRGYARLQGWEYQEQLESLGEVDLRTPLGDAVCVPSVP